MPNLVYDTPTPPSQLYSSSSAAPGAAFPASSLRPRFQQQPNQTVVTSTVLPKSRLREQYRPEMDFDLDGSSSDSTFSSTDLAADNNNSPRTKYAGAAPGAADENRPPLGYYRSPGYGDASMGAGMNDKQRFLDVQPSSRQHQQQQRGGSLGTRVDEHSDATLSSSTRSMSSDSEDEVAVQARQQRKQQFSAYPNKTSATANNITSTPYPGMGSTSNNISKSAFDGMARELRKEFDRIMHAGQEPTSSNNHVLTSARSNSSPPPFRTRRNSALQAHAVATSPSYVQDAPTPLPRGVLPRRPSSSAAAAPRPSAPATRDHERTPTTQRTSQRMFGQEIRFPRQDTAAPPASYQPPRFSPPKASITEQKQPAWQDYQAASPFRATSTTARPGTGPPDSTRPTSKPSFRAADSPGKHSNASSYAGVRVPDVTGLTEGLTSPSRIESGPSSHKHFSNANGSPISSGRTFRGTHEGERMCTHSILSEY